MNDYDKVANIYDKFYSAANDLKENKVIQGVLNRLCGRSYASVIDIGCGTGLALELLPEKCKDLYLGFDPSSAMIDVLLHKFPDASAMVGSLRRKAVREAVLRRLGLFPITQRMFLTG